MKRIFQLIRKRKRNAQLLQEITEKLKKSNQNILDIMQELDDLANEITKRTRKSDGKDL